MLFNSIDFAIFLPIVFTLYWLANKNLKLQNLVLIGASYLFYGMWDWRFLFLLFGSTCVDFMVGRGLAKLTDQSKRKLLLWTSISVNLGVLGFFKYFNFFQENFVAAFSFFGAHVSSNSLNVILPVGVSFYTFQALSYSIDAYKRKLEPAKDFISFVAFVSFFPQLVAGPIERAVHLYPQFITKRKFDYSKAVDGLRQILWGLFKKIVIADNCAEYANIIFNNSGDYSGSTLVVGALFFTVQIYCDFSGYSDIAIGLSRLFGFNLMRNFAFPYFSRDIAEFWRKWHISLSSWFRDYVYIPLGGSKVNVARQIFITIAVFVISGFWHGAKWTFIAWGLLNALYFLPLLLAKRNRANLDIVAKDRYLPSFKETVAMLFTFSLTVFAWIFFRAESIGHAFNYISTIFSASLFTIPTFQNRGYVLPIIILTTCFFIIEWLGRTEQFAIAKILTTKPRLIRLSFYYLLIILIFVFAGSDQQFIYFQF